MKINHRFTFNCNNKKIISFLKGKKIDINYGDIINFIDIFTDDNRFDDVVEFLEAYDVKYYPHASQCIYTRDELDSAEWLIMESS